MVRPEGLEPPAYLIRALAGVQTGGLWLRELHTGRLYLAATTGASYLASLDVTQLVPAEITSGILQEAADDERASLALGSSSVGGGVGLQCARGAGLCGPAARALLSLAIDGLRALHTRASCQSLRFGGAGRTAPGLPSSARCRAEPEPATRGGVRFRTWRLTRHHGCGMATSCSGPPTLRGDHRGSCHWGRPPLEIGSPIASAAPICGPPSAGHS